MYQLIKCISGQNPFRTVSNVYLIFQLGTFFINKFRHTFRRINRRSRFYHKQVALLQIRYHRPCCSLHISDIGTVILLKRSRYNNKKSVSSLGFGYGSEMSVTYNIVYNFPQVRLYNMYFPLINSFHYCRIHIYTNHLISMSSCYSSRRQADIT